MEKELASDTKLWAETRTVRLNLKAAKDEAAAAKRHASEARLKVALNNKADLDKVLSKEKAESDEAYKKLQKEKAELENTHKDLAKAALRLQKLRGYTPDEALKSGAHVQSGLSFLALLAMHVLL